MKDALKKGNSVLLEPFFKVEVVTPEEYMGDVMGGLNSKRGLIQGMEARSGAQVINAFVPLSEMFGYSVKINYSRSCNLHYDIWPLWASSSFSC